MSHEAQTWVSKLDTRLGPSTRFVLVALANYANDDDLAWVARRRIAEYTELSLATVTRSLRELEERGLIAREERTRDNGSRTTDMIRLNVGFVPAPTTPPCHGDEGGTPHSDKAPLSQCAGGLVTVTRPDPKDDPKEEITPHSPPEGGVARKIKSGIGEEEGAADPLLDALLAILQPDPTFNLKATRRRWRRMTPAARQEAVAGAQRFVDHCRANKRRLPDPPSYLADERWKTTANLPAPAPKPEAAPRPVETDPLKRVVEWALSDKADRASWVFVAEGSDAWRDWHRAFIATGYGHRFMRGKPQFLPQPGGGFGYSEPGRMFPLPRPGGHGADPPPLERPSDDDIADNL
ncbi:helix-turn-helix domain-containing protein [Ancylobacter sp. VNQ12]|uniref:helix-turn-helix domain-containing protein n=1 Tax=Ancylobacter sp. VNQ12 TaxID=3400920 RepID=UPI003C02D022